MPKFSQIPTNASPALTDFLIAVTAGSVDQKSTIAAIAALISANLTAGSVTPPKQASNIQRATGLRVVAFTTTSASAVDVSAPGNTVSITTTGGALLIFYATAYHNSTNTATFYVNIDGVATQFFQGSRGSITNTSNMIKIPSIAAGAHTVKIQVSIPGAATFTLDLYEENTLLVQEIGN